MFCSQPPKKCFGNQPILPFKLSPKGALPRVPYLGLSASVMVSAQRCEAEVRLETLT